jgi:triosephosphate isomerase
MNFTLSDAEEFLAEWKNKDLNNSHIKTIFCPSSTELFAIAGILEKSYAELGAQNVYYKTRGAFTGEISCKMLKETGCKWVLIGHSERRSILGETDEMICQKLYAVLTANLFPILCIGETIDERNAGNTTKVLQRQLLMACENIDSTYMNTIVIAYEPVWAIGTGITPTNDVVAKTHRDIRNILNENGLMGDEISILYGGSVSDHNATSLSDIDDVDGFLIGGASLDVDKFYSIYNQL